MQEGNKREKRRETMSDVGWLDSVVVTFRWRWRWRWWWRWWWWNLACVERERKAGTSRRHPDITQSLHICWGQISLSQTCKNSGSASTWQKMKYRWERGLFSLQLSPPPPYSTPPHPHTPSIFFASSCRPPARQLVGGRGWWEDEARSLQGSGYFQEAIVLNTKC